MAWLVRSPREPLIRLGGQPRWTFKEPVASGYFIRVLRGLRGLGARLVKAIVRLSASSYQCPGPAPAAAAIFQASSKRDGSVRA